MHKRWIFFRLLAILCILIQMFIPISILAENINPELFLSVNTGFILCTYSDIINIVPAESEILICCCGIIVKERLLGR